MKRTNSKADRGLFDWLFHHRIESRLLIAFLLVISAMFGLGKLAGEVLEGDTFAIDIWIVRELRTVADAATPVAPQWVTTAMIDFTALGGVTVLTLVSLFAVGFLFVTSRKWIALFVAISVCTGAATNAVLKTIFARARPDLVPHLVNADTASFPSGHAMNSALVYLTLAMLVGRTENNTHLRVYLVSCAIILTFLVGSSRVYLGVHWPSDVLAGWGVGALWAVLSTVGLKYFQTKENFKDMSNVT